MAEEQLAEQSEEWPVCHLPRRLASADFL